MCYKWWQFFCWAKKCEYDKKFRLVYRKPLPKPKSLEKGRENGNRLVFERKMWHQKLKTFIKTIFTSKVIMFEKTFEFKNAIFFCYGRYKFVIYNKEYLKPKCGVLLKRSHLFWILLYQPMWWINIRAIGCCPMHWQKPLPLLWTWKLRYYNFLMGLKSLTFLKLKSSFCTRIC